MVKNGKRIENEYKTENGADYPRCPEENRRFAIEAGIEDPQTLWEEFYDYWISATGKNARKLQWGRTFRNWVRKHKQWNSRAYGGNRSSRPTNNSLMDGAKLAMGRKGNY